MHDSQGEGKYIPVDKTQCIWQNIAYACALVEAVSDI